MAICIDETGIPDHGISKIAHRFFNDKRTIIFKQNYDLNRVAERLCSIYAAVSYADADVSGGAAVGFR